MGAHKDSKRILCIKNHYQYFLFLRKPLQHEVNCVIERRLIALQEAIRANAVVYHEKRVRMKAMRRKHDREERLRLRKSVLGRKCSANTNLSNGKFTLDSHTISCCRNQLSNTKLMFSTNKQEFAFNAWNFWLRAYVGKKKYFNYGTVWSNMTPTCRELQVKSGKQQEKPRDCWLQRVRWRIWKRD